MADINVVKEIRERSHASLKDCRTAADEAGGDVERALRLLQEKGVIAAAGRSRVANEGRVQTYVHGPDSRLTVVVEVNCETDFAARTDDFKVFCESVAMQIAATSPLFVSAADVSEEARRDAEVLYRAQLPAGKPEQVLTKILGGKMDKWLDEVCLLRQKSIEDDSKTIDAMRLTLSAKLGETITIRRFVRWSVGEGIEKPKADYAAEVVAAGGV